MSGAAARGPQHYQQHRPDLRDGGAGSCTVQGETDERTETYLGHPEIGQPGQNPSSLQHVSHQEARVREDGARAKTGGAKGSAQGGNGGANLQNALVYKWHLLIIE